MEQKTKETMQSKINKLKDILKESIDDLMEIQSNVAKKQASKK